MDPLVASTIINTGANLLGGLFGKKSKGPDPLYLQEESQKIANRYSLDYATKYPSAAAYGFKEAGIHPVYGLGGGAAMGQMPGINIGGGGANEEAMSHMQTLGQGLSRVASAYLSREEREVAQASAALGLENQKLQNDRLRSEIALMNAPGQGPGLSETSAIPGQGDARYPLQARMPMGLGDTAPLLRIGRDQKGNPIRVYNDDLGDNEVLQMLTSLGFSVPDWIRGNLTQPAAKGLRNFVKNMRSLGSQYSKFRK